MARRHLRGLLSLDRSEFENLLLLAAAWSDSDLRPGSLGSRRVGVIDSSGDSALQVALRIAAHAAAVELIPIPADLATPAAGVAALAPVLDAIVVVDPAGTAEAWYAQHQVSVINILGPGGSPIEVIAHLQRQLQFRSLKNLSVTWVGPGTPALQSWVELTADARFNLTQVAERTDISPEFLTQLRAEGQLGRFTVQPTMPAATDLEVQHPLDIRSRACAIAAILEYELHRN